MSLRTTDGAKNAISSKKREDSPKKFKLSEIAKHTTEKDLWCIIHGKVYDFSGYPSCHPGGAQIFYDVAGKDASKEWDESEHPFWVDGQLKSKMIGIVDTDPEPENE